MSAFTAGTFEIAWALDQQLRNGMYRLQYGNLAEGRQGYENEHRTVWTQIQFVKHQKTIREEYHVVHCSIKLVLSLSMSSC